MNDVLISSCSNTSYTDIYIFYLYFYHFQKFNANKATRLHVEITTSKQYRMFDCDFVIQSTWFVAYKFSGCLHSCSHSCILSCLHSCFHSCLKPFILYYLVSVNFLIVFFCLRNNIHTCSFVVIMAKLYFCIITCVVPKSHLCVIVCMIEMRHDDCIFK